MSPSLVKALVFSAAMLAVGAWLLPARAQDMLPPGPGRDETVKVCSACHGVENFTGIRHNRATWEGTIDNMINFGATISDEDYETVATYLTTYLGLAPPPAAP